MSEIPEDRKQEALDAGVAEEDTQKVWNAFSIYDSDGTGSIDQTELRHVMQIMGCDVSDNSVEKLLKESDTDGDGTLNFAEYCKMVVKKRKDKDSRQKKLREAFETFDTDGTGYLDREELKSFLTQMGIDPIEDDEVDDLLDVADIDKDGKLSIEEFVRVFTMDVDEMIEQNEDRE